MSDDLLEQLVTDGQRLQKADRDGAEARASLEVAAADTERRARLYASLSTFARWGWFLAGSGLGLLIFLTLPRVFDPGRDVEEGGTIPVAISSVVALAPIFLLRWLRSIPGERAIAREEAWLQARPFLVTGYFHALGESTTEGTATLHIVFAPATSKLPTDEELGAMFRTTGARAESSQGDRERRVSYTFTLQEGSRSSNPHLRDWVHRAMHLLELLHARHAIEEVRVTGFE